MLDRSDQPRYVALVCPDVRVGQSGDEFHQTAPHQAGTLPHLRAHSHPGGALPNGLPMKVPKTLKHRVCEDLGISLESRPTNHDICEHISRKTGWPVPAKNKKRWRHMIVRYANQYHLASEIQAEQRYHPNSIEHCVYIVQRLDNNKPIKIGVTKNLKTRLKSLQTASHCELLLVGIVKTHNECQARKIERYMHECLSEYRLHGEWFQRRSISILKRLKVIEGFSEEATDERGEVVASGER